MNEKMKNSVIRGCYAVLGIAILAFGIALQRYSGFGTDPFTCATLGMSSKLPISFGTFQMLVNIALFIPIFLSYRKSFGFGAVVVTLGLAYFIDFYVWLITTLGISIESLKPYFALRILLLIAGVLLLCLGMAVYMACDMGASPYDMLGKVVEIKTDGKVPFKWFRIGTDIICVFIGFVFGAVIGIGTLFISLCTGPIVTWFRKNLAERIVPFPLN